ncbi:MAG: DUF3408 domain-containing protein [Prevotellaceae bacterium]|jgi:hypothetical protein|nr:DUF3408 domain-containing protein [Prevotellaceae bacterium]
MAKKNAGIDEKVLLAMMGTTVVPVAAAPPAAEVDAVHEEVSQQVGVPTVEEVEDSVAVKSEKAVKNTPPAVKYRKGSYEDLFLVKSAKGSKAKLTQFRLRADTHKRLSTIVHAAHGGSISLIDYVDNVLEHHLCKYKDELQRCCNERQKEIVDFVHNGKISHSDSAD